MRSFSSLMVSSLRLRLACRDLTRDSAACTSIEWSAALAARTAASRSSTCCHTAPICVIPLLGRAGLHSGAPHMQIVHPRSKSCILGANFASQVQIVHPRCKLCILDAKCASQVQIVPKQLQPRAADGAGQDSISMYCKDTVVASVRGNRWQSIKSAHMVSTTCWCYLQASSTNVGSRALEFLSNTCLSDATSQLAQPHALLCASGPGCM